MRFWTKTPESIPTQQYQWSFITHFTSRNPFMNPCFHHHCFMGITKSIPFHGVQLLLGGSELADLSRLREFFGYFDGKRTIFGTPKSHSQKQAPQKCMVRHGPWFRVNLRAKRMCCPRPLGSIQWEAKRRGRHEHFGHWGSWSFVMLGSWALDRTPSQTRNPKP